MRTESEKLTNKELNIIAKTLDKVIGEYEKNNAYILTKESDRKALLYESKTLFAKTRPCVIPGCKNRSICRSHAIQKAHSLDVIAEKKHVYTPFFNKKNGKLEVKKIGINHASTFPGFCQKHEKIFHVFERIKDVETDKSVTLQIFRTIARELVVKESALERFLMMKDSYLKFREKRISELFFNKVKKEIPKINKFPKSCKITYKDSKLKAIDKEIRKISLDIDFVKTKFFVPLCTAIFSNSHHNAPLYIYKIEVPERIPICLAGRGSFHVGKNSVKHEIHAFLNVLPLHDKTMLYIAVDLKHQEFLKFYINRFLQTALPGLNLAETWMVRGSDHWFIQPSIWESLDMSRKERVLKDIMDTNFTIAEFYNFSIFNKLRKSIINSHKGAYKNANDKMKRKIDREINKL